MAHGDVQKTNSLGSTVEFHYTNFLNNDIISQYYRCAKCKTNDVCDAKFNVLVVLGHSLYNVLNLLAKAQLVEYSNVQYKTISDR